MFLTSGQAKLTIPSVNLMTPSPQNLLYVLVGGLPCAARMTLLATVWAWLYANLALGFLTPVSPTSPQT